MLAGQLALVVAAIFTGAAFYINFAEHPARLKLENPALLAQWKPSYKRGFTMQASLAVIGCLLGVWQWYLADDWRWLAGAGLLILNWPYTLAVIMPVNKRLLAVPTNAITAEMRARMHLWGHLHAGRTLLGAASVLAYLWALL